MGYFRQFLVFLFLSVLAFSSCIDDNFTDIDTSITYEADASLPLGNSFPLLGELLDTINLVEIPDWVNKDTVSFFLYDSIYYYSPGKIKFTTTGYFALNPFENDTVKITSLMFRTNIVNAIPAEVDQQLYFTDTSNTVIDSLYSAGPLEIQPALSDTAGNIIATWELLKNDIYLSDEMIDTIMNTQHIVLSAELIIPDSSEETIHFLSSHNIWIQIGMRVGLKIEF